MSCFDVDKKMLDDRWISFKFVFLREKIFLKIQFKKDLLKIICIHILDHQNYNTPYGLLSMNQNLDTLIKIEKSLKHFKNKVFYQLPSPINRYYFF